MVNLLPLAEGETITTVLPLPQDEAEWGGLHIMFATAKGTVRRNSMDAFTNISDRRADRRSSARQKARKRRIASTGSSASSC
jgi:DNA gyrase/topoisomerase IV subunit A